MITIIRKSEAEIREQKIREAKRTDAAMKAEIAKGKRRSINAGYSEPGFNFGLGKYIHDKYEYQKEVKNAQAENPDLLNVG